MIKKISFNFLLNFQQSDLLNICFVLNKKENLKIINTIEIEKI